MNQQKFAMINPEIIHVEGEQIGDEGCLSFPGIFQKIQRNMRTIVRYQNVKGEMQELDGDEFDCPLCSARNRPLRRHRFSRPDDTSAKRTCQTQNQKIAENRQMGIMYAAEN